MLSIDSATQRRRPKKEVISRTSNVKLRVGPNSGISPVTLPKEEVECWILMFCLVMANFSTLVKFKLWNSN